MKVLLDTDPGIDDAMALLMLARDTRAHLVGISTVFGNAAVEQTCRNTLALCERFGIDVPVARGAARPLVRDPRPFPVRIHGCDGLGDIGLPPPRRQHDAPGAADFIVDQARRHSGELTLLAVGPLTNLALALVADPQLPRHVRQVVVMAGAFGHHGHHGNATACAEANVYCDPHAAAAVFAADWPLSMVGLDVTQQVVLPTAWLDALRGDEARFLRDMARGYQAFHRERGIDGLYAHDASAVACALDPSRFVMRRGAVRVVTDGAAMGQTLQSLGVEGTSAVRVCIGVDAAGVRSDIQAALERGRYG